MKVLLIDVNCKYSSTGKIVYDLFRKLKAEGHEAAVCYGRGEVIREEGIYKFGLDWETRIHAGLARITGLNGYFSPISTKRLIRFIEKFQPDVIHIHELHAYFVNLKPLINYIKLKKIKVVWTFHCEYMYTGKCGHAYECLNFQKECGDCPAVKDYPKSLFFDKTRKMLKDKKELLGDLDFTIVTPSQWLADRVKMSFLRDKKINVIHNGIDTSIFHPVDTTELRSRWKIDKNKKIVLFIAPEVMDKRKGGQWVLEIAKMMEKEDIVFLMVGGGIQPQKYNGNIIFVGAINNPNVLAQYYSMADIFLLCSERETYSMTCAEALSCGTPVVGFKCGAPETVFKGAYVKFVEYGDLLGLMLAILGALDLKKCKKINIDYSVDNMANQYVFQYRKCN